MTEFRENPLPGLIDQWQAAAPVMRGILLMCVASVFFSAMHVLVRYVARDVPPLQIAFLRNIFGVIVFAPLLMSSGLAFLRTKRIGLHAVRGALNAVALLMFFTALSLTPVARVTALSFSAPLFTALLSVVFLGERCAEESHDPGAHHLVDRFLVTVNSLHHVFEDGVEDLPRLLGVPVGQQLHGPLEISKQHCDLLALPFQGAFGCEDLLGEMPRSIGAWGAKFRGGHRGGGVRLGQRMAALLAKLRAKPIRLPATGAGCFEP